jgi:hypothetical protein
MISPEVIKSFLDKKPEPIFPVRGKSPEWLLDVIKRTTGVEFSSKLPWTGSDRDQRQLEAITLAIIKKQLLLYYGMRTGKTRISLDWIQHLRRCGWIKRAFVVPHAPAGLDEWEIQTPKHSDLRGFFIRSGADSAIRLADAVESDCEMIVAAPSTLQQIFSVKRANRKGKPTLYADNSTLKLMTGCYQAFVCDEIHGAMWPSSLRHDIMVALAHHADWRLGLTGTPFGRDPFGMWGQAYIVDGGQTLGRTFYFFEQAFGVEKYNHFSRTKKEWLFNPKMMKTLRVKMEHLTLACPLEEIQDVQVLSSTIQLQLSKPQQNAYQELIREMIAAQQEPDERRRVENIFVRLRQVSSGFRPFRDDDGEARIVEFADATKYEWLHDFLSNLDPDTKVLLFHEFVPTGRRLVRLCEKLKLPHGWLWGGAKDKLATRLNFQRGKTQVLIANHGTGGTGIDLSAADYMCVVESPTSVIAREQMLARPLARTRPLIVDDLVCSPVEEKILSFHREGKELMNSFRGAQDFARSLAIRGSV